MSADLERLLRAARRAEPAPPPLAHVLGRRPARARVQAAPALAALGGLALVIAVLAVSPPRPHAPVVWAAAPPPSTDWLAEPVAAESLRAVPYFQAQAPFAPPSIDWLAEPVASEDLRSVPSLEFLGDDNADL